ncbi:putative hydrolase Ecym_4058 [Eremothecium cymbalariae DBVPG|uniref:DUF676 domain-containing protein n=1 Tax=Eremothecium cymbalariae (strain CBS 270.75 / DBVPG 7215 / KCTC 17166 / NRRL Y-17582) TaxID=931890 RepID=G8JSY6_ERECY|nr:hypothetical protein Ecym_4058 [Eremothecium cymbalariae DBVPG\
MSDRGKHLLVLVHGLWGSHTHMGTLKQLLAETFAEDDEFNEDEILFYLPRENGYLKTLHGVDYMGYQVIIELCEFVKNYGERRIGKISFIGYSMGGLVSRYVIGKIFTECKELFGHMEPVFYMSFATPHLGLEFYTSQDPNSKSLVMDVFLMFLRFIGMHALGRSGRQMFLAYEQDDTLVKLTEGEFIKQLGRFKYRIAFANVKNDRTVAFYTSFISDYDPFIETNNKLLYKFDTQLPTKGVLGVNPRIVDFANLDPSVKCPNNRKFHLVLFWCVVFLSLAFTVFPLVLVFNLMATIYSYAVTIAEQSQIAKGDGRQILRQKLGLENNSNVTTGAETCEPDTDSADVSARCPSGESESISWSRFLAKYSSNTRIGNKFRRLPFDPKRAKMFANLNKLTWIRIPIYIKSINSHDGIVVRNGLKASSTMSIACACFTAHFTKYILLQEQKRAK